tara:strand:+ start:26772 stop:27620 length:849 start_codon:yes stop_codon:yes gene_type:complete
MTLSDRAPLPLDAVSFREIADLAYRESGLTLVEEKAMMIQSRLRHRLRALGLTDFGQYSAYVSSDAGRDERKQLISALTTNVSHFFRESHHFDSLKEMLDARLPNLRAGGRMRIWSAGCSNGQEALSAAVALLDHCPEVSRLNLRILATDIDPKVVEFARQGRYDTRLTDGIPKALINQYFDADTEGADTVFSPKSLVRNMISFNELNLLADWPMKGRFDVIFCRNVVIYFDLATQNALWPRFHSLLAPDGVLFLGHSERIADPSAYGFVCTGPTTYRHTAH